MNNALLLVVGLVSSAAVHAGRAPVESVPIVSDLGLMGISVILAACAARFAAKKLRKQ